MRVIDLTTMLPTIAMAHIVVGGKEGQATNQTLVFLVFGPEIMPTRSEMGILGCLVGTVYFALFALPSLVHRLIIGLSQLPRFLVPDCLGDVFLHRKRDDLDR